MDHPSPVAAGLEVRRGVLIARPWVPLETVLARGTVVGQVKDAMGLHANSVVLDLCGADVRVERALTLAIILMHEVRGVCGWYAVACDDEIWGHAMRLTHMDSLLATRGTVDEAVEAVLEERGGSGRRTPRLLAMISGGGRTLSNLLDAIEQRRVNAAVVHVISSREGPGVDRARTRGLSVEIVAGSLSSERFQATLAAHAIDLVVLAGYLKIVPVPQPYRGRILNIHPGLLPKFGGAGMHGQRVHEAVLASGDIDSGCTVHVCDEAFDTGPIILQRRCPVRAGDTPGTLAERVFEQECIAYPAAVRSVLDSLGFPQPRLSPGGAAA